MNIAIYRLMAGFRRFRDKYFVPEHLEESIYHRLASSGQTPKTLLIGCSDSRVDPAILSGASPGELFVIRNVANLVPPCETTTSGFHGTSSAIEFAVKNLKVDNVIILGHRQCGGIRALMKDAYSDESFIGQWMQIAKEAKQIVQTKYAESDHEHQCKMAEMESIRVSLKNLKSFPFVQEAIKDRQMNLIGVYFDLELGQLWNYDDSLEEFRQLEI